MPQTAPVVKIMSRLSLPTSRDFCSLSACERKEVTPCTGRIVDLTEQLKNLV